MRRLHITYILFLLFNLCWGQDPHFSQFYSNSLYLSPSFAGVNQQNRFSLNMRQQWPSISNGYKTLSASYDRDFERINSGLGVLFLNDFSGAGMLGSLNIGLLYSYDFRINQQWHIRPGIHFMYTERRLNFDELIWSDQISPDGNAPSSGEMNPFNNVGDIDFSTSAITYNDNIWFGVTFDHLLRPNQSLFIQEYNDKNQGKLPIKYSIFGGMKFIVSQELLRPIPTSIHFTYLYRQQADFKQLDFGFYYYKDPLVLGFWYRGIPVVKPTYSSDAFIMLIGYKSKFFSIGYSYDFTFSRLITSTGGAHEISVAYSFVNKIRKKKRKMVPCPVF